MRRLAISIVLALCSGALASWPAAAGAQLLATEEARLAPPAYEANTSEEFGSSVDVSVGTMIVGVPDRDITSPSALYNVGAAYVFVGTMRTQIVPTTRRSESRFGDAVAIDGTTAIVGAGYEAISGTGTEEGAVYVFGRDAGGVWTQLQRITAGGEAAPGDNFGRGLAIDGDWLAIGAPGRATDQGAVYVFQRDAAGWTLRQRLEAPDAAIRRSFGGSVAISGATIVAGGYNYFNTAAETAHVFERDAAGTWSHVATLQPADGTVGDRYGSDVAVDEDRVLVGSPGNATTGSVYVYERSAAGAWEFRQKLQRTGSSGFGGAVAIDGDLAVIGAAATASNAGAAYAFVRDPGTGTWGFGRAVPAVAPRAGDLYGNAVALDGSRAVIGALGEDVEMPTDAGWDDGAAHPVVFRLQNGSACSSRSAAICEATFCVDGVCCATACDGACDACSTAAGATVNGTCALTTGNVCRPAADACDIEETCSGASAACPDDVVMPMCTADAGPPPVDASVGGDAGPSDGGGRDAQADASSDTIPRRTLSCTCRAGLEGAGGRTSIAGLLALAATLLGRRRARRPARGPRR